MPNHIIIADYDSRWPDIFRRESAVLRTGIASWLVDIQHIGSTAVPGLAAKPIVDIMIGLQDFTEADRHCIEPVKATGYEYVQRFENELPERRYFRKDSPTGVRLYHLHMVEHGGEFWVRHLLFRDYLRAHSETAREYEQVKRRLARRYVNTNDYAEAKSEFIADVQAKALRWQSDLCEDSTR